ncbi:sensor domain-containing diguanylate cyclase [Vibrio sp. 10N]|uniref:sensor domain-containing diguanylate cyclase n=1 Tax=Vibrio sp. 10N TaxID=3058938 RepID=UPI002813DCD9|nr:hypothetical protein VB10N_13250 [Vibrio sp. 10N]
MRLSTKISLALTGSLLVFFFAIAWLSYQGSQTLLIKNIEERMAQSTNIAYRSLQEKLKDIERVNETLVSLVREQVKTNSGAAQLATTVHPFLNNNPSFSSISIVSRMPIAQELVRVERDNTGNIVRASRSQLNSLSHIPIFIEATAASKGSVYVSSVTTHYDRISYPDPKPFIFIVYPLTKNNDQGLSLLIAIDVERLLKGATQLLSNPTMLTIANTDGSYLLHPNSEKQFAFVKGKIEKLQIDHPEAKPTIEENQATFFEIDGGEQSERLQYAYFLPAIFKIHSTSTEYILGLQQKDTIGGMWMDKTAKALGLTSLTLIAIVSVLSFSLFRFITIPLTNIARFAKRITLEKSTPYKYDAQDEIGDLTRALNYLQSNLNAHYVQLKNSEQKFQEMARLDDLTNLPNRKDFYEKLESEVNHHRINQLHFALLFIDINNFKQVNDKEGHDVGDKFLKGVAQLLSKNLRSSDLVCRYGGDEFIVVLSNLKQLDVIHSICSKLHQSTHSLVRSEKLSGYDLSLSIGVAVYPESSTNAKDLIKVADQAMYRAKAKGHATTYWHTPFY